MKKLLAALLLCYTSTQMYAQNAKPLKIGYTNVELVASLMPEMKAVMTDVNNFQIQQRNYMEKRAMMFQEKVGAYQKQQGMMTETAKKAKEAELMKSRDSLETMQSSMDAQLQKKQYESLKPLSDKVDKAVKDVAAENGYTFIFNTDAGQGTTPILLYGPPEYDITDLVKKKLGIVR